MTLQFDTPAIAVIFSDSIISLSLPKFLAVVKQRAQCMPKIEMIAVVSIAPIGITSNTKDQIRAEQNRA